MTAIPWQDIRVLMFDVFGTIVDWRGSILRFGERYTRRCPIRPSRNWSEIATEFARRYAQQVHSGTYSPLNSVFWSIASSLVGEFDIADFSQNEWLEFATIWSCLDPWPDSRSGLGRIRDIAMQPPYQVVALSNANEEMGLALGKSAALPWSDVIGPDVVRVYKPDPKLYLYALDRMGVKPREAVMVAAHLFDLRGAKSVGMRTVFLVRPGEETGDPQADYVDAIVGTLDDLRKLMGEPVPS